MSIMDRVKPSDGCVPQQEWARVIKEEYINSLIPSGGSAVKFVSGHPASLLQAKDILLKDAADCGMCTAFLDPSLLVDEKKPDLHRIERFFFAATRGIDWRDYAQRLVRKHFSNNGVLLPEGDDLDIQTIERLNPGMSAPLLRQHLMQLANSLVRDHGLAYEFRSALASLAQSLVDPQPGQPTLEEAVLLWLGGKTRPGASAILKKVQIYDRITVRNARHMMMSFTRWLPEAGHSGMVVVLDFRPYERKRTTRSVVDRQIREAIERGADTSELQSMLQRMDPRGQVFYSDSAYVQMLSLLRHFIDDIDQFERLLLVVLTSPDYYDSASARNYNNYDALQTRIGLEVRDEHRANPVAALVHLSGESI